MTMPDGGLASLAEDLILLSTRPNNTLMNASRLTYALRGSELVRLAAAGRAGVDKGKIFLRDGAPTGDPALDAALADLARRRRPPSARDWVSYARPQIRDGYLRRMAAAGTLSAERGGLFRGRRYKIADQARAAAARARLDAVASTDAPVDLGAAALAGLAVAAGLPAVLYPGWAGRTQRRRLEQAGEGRRSAAPTIPGTAEAAAAARAAARDTRPDAGPVPRTGAPGSLLALGGGADTECIDDTSRPAASAASHAAAHAGTQAATEAATQASVHAAAHAAAHAGTQAATQAATQASVHAATHAATEAAVHAAAHAATHAATEAAVHAAVHAATHAAVEAAHHAAGSGGGFDGGAGGHGGGGHGGGGHGGGGGGHG
jgi:hypothetical protein